MEAQLREQKAEAAEVKKPNLTGIPIQMKLDFEQRSGLSFDDVRVHYNSDKPAQLGALAYTQGNEVYMGPGQERHLSHELGHVVQQKAGRVRPTGWINGLPVNDQPELEREADRAPVQRMPAPALWGVVQMNLMEIPQQSGNNCGYHALARALLQFFAPSGSSGLTKENLADRLTSYAIQAGFSIIGEAFDAEALAYVGQQFCIENHINAECSSIPFDSQSRLEDILIQSKQDKSVILVPYYTDTSLGVKENDKERPQENAHWSTIDTNPQEGTSQTGIQLYEGNRHGSLGARYLPPTDVEPQPLADSNQSIQPQFDWNKFIWGRAFQQIFPDIPIGRATDAMRKNIEVAVECLADEYRTYRRARAESEPKSKSESELPDCLQTKYDFIHSEDGKQALRRNARLNGFIIRTGINYINDERREYAGAKYEDYGEFITGFQTVRGKIEALPHHRSDFPRATGHGVQGVNLRGLVVKVIGK